MSTQRRVVRWQRTKKLAGTADPPSQDGKVSAVSFRRATDGRTASLFALSSIWTSGRREWATNSLSFSSSCPWVQRNSLGCFLPEDFNEVDFDEVEQHDRFFSSGAVSARRNPIPGSFPSSDSRFLPSYPALQGVLPAPCSRPCRRSHGKSPGTERQYGQGNLYFEHAA